MIDALLAWSIAQRSLVLMLCAVFVACGAMAALAVPIDAVPDVTNVQVQIQTRAPALGPVDVETYVTAPVERAVAGIPHVEQIRSISRAGISVVTVVFEDGTKLLTARQLLAERLGRARDEIPPGYGSPELGPMASGLGEIFHFEVRAEGKSLMDRRAILDWQVAPRLRMVRGVVDVNAFGGESRTLEITVDPQRLAAAKLGVHELREAVQKNHIAVGGAWVQDGREHVVVRGEGRITGPEDLASVVIDSRDGTPILVRDVATVQFAPLARYGAVTRDGRGEAVVGVVMMAVGANAADVVAQVKATLVDVGRSLPEGVTVEAFYDRTDLVHRTIDTVRKNLLEAVVLVTLVLGLTLMSLRAGLVVTISIPLALLGVFAGMWAIGLSGNLLSLGAIDFGLVVDGAIILVENAQRRLADRRRELGRDLEDAERRDVVLQASREVRAATLFGEAIIALVYVPILALQGVEGRMFRPMATAVLFALGTAFVLSLTVVPAFASFALSRAGIDRPSPLVSFARRLYRPALAAAMRRPVGTVLAALAAFAASMWVAFGMGAQFVPKLDEGTIVVSTVTLPSASLEQTTALSTQIEGMLRRFPEVTSVVSRSGRAELAIDPMGMNMTDIYVLLRPREEWTTAKSREGLVEAMDEVLSKSVPGVGFNYQQPIEMNTNDLLAGVSSDVAIHIYGDDLGRLAHLAERAARLLRDVPGAHDVRAEMVAGSQVMEVTVDRAEVARYGLDADAVLEGVAAIGGIEVGAVVEKRQRYPIQIRLAPEARASPEAIASLPVRTREGDVLPLAQLARITNGPGPSTIARERLARRVTVQLNVRGRDLATFVHEAEARLRSRLELPTGYALSWGGEYERLSAASKRLMVLVPVTVALIFVLLLATFGRTGPALLILLNVPVAVSGGVLALAARGMDLSISAGVGFIALFGVAVLNGLVLVSTIERLALERATIADAVRDAAEERLRPVLTTALVAAIGFVPMAISTGAGAEVQRPLATVVIGGIVTSTLLTLLVVPAVVMLTGRRRQGPAATA